MHHYPHHISDFNNATRHLTRVERSIYRDLIELYYETEAPLSLDLNVICRRIIANECSTDVERTLNEFFVKTPNGWYHSRCEEVIEQYRTNQSQKAMAGKASAAKKEAKKQQAINGKSTGVEQPFNGRSTDVEQTNNGASTNQEPITNNHIEDIGADAPSHEKPKVKRKKSDGQTFDEWIASKPEGEPAIPADDPIIAWFGTQRMPEHWPAIAWVAFRNRYTGKPKTYLDWRAVFRDHVRGDYLRLWAKDRAGQWFLTTAGVQAEAEIER